MSDVRKISDDIPDSFWKDESSAINLTHIKDEEEEDAKRARVLSSEEDDVEENPKRPRFDILN